MRLTKIYTKVGDKGSTMLASGAFVPKNAPRIEAYGTVDELNACVGLLRDTLVEFAPSGAPHEKSFRGIVAALLQIQNELFDVGGELATPTEVLDTTKQQVVGPDAIARLEREMDAFNEQLAPLANFVLPGGHRANSLAHVARTVCRRAERRLVSLTGVESIRTEPCIYLNRLSDWFFVVSRIISQSLSTPEVLWKQKGKN